MTAPVITVVTEEQPEESAPVIQPVVLPDNPAVLELAATVGRLQAELEELRVRNLEAATLAGVAEAKAEVATELAEGAQATAEIAAIVATETAAEPVAEAEVEAEPEEDKRPVKQHWAFRERDEWRNK